MKKLYLELWLEEMIQNTFQAEISACETSLENKSEGA